MENMRVVASLSIDGKMEIGPCTADFGTETPEVRRVKIDQHYPFTWTHCLESDIIICPGPCIEIEMMVEVKDESLPHESNMAEFTTRQPHIVRKGHRFGIRIPKFISDKGDAREQEQICTTICGVKEWEKDISNIMLGVDISG